MQSAELRLGGRTRHGRRHARTRQDREAFLPLAAEQVHCMTIRRGREVKSRDNAEDFSTETAKFPLCFIRSKTGMQSWPRHGRAGVRRDAGPANRGQKRLFVLTPKRSAQTDARS